MTGPPPPYELVWDNEIGIEEVSRKLLEIDIAKSLGYDDINSNLLKEVFLTLRIEFTLILIILN